MSEASILDTIRIIDSEGVTLAPEDFKFPLPEALADVYAGIQASVCSEILSTWFSADEINDTVHVYLPVVWGDTDGIGGGRVENPLTLRIGLALGNSTDANLWMETSLNHLVEAERDLNGGQHEPSMARFSAALRELADDVDKHLRKE